jgi:hypothetical protein
MLEALCRQSSTTLDILHAEDGPPITQRTSGLKPPPTLPIRCRNVALSHADQLAASLPFLPLGLFRRHRTAISPAGNVGERARRRVKICPTSVCVQQPAVHAADLEPVRLDVKRYDPATRTCCLFGVSPSLGPNGLPKAAPQAQVRGRLNSRHWVFKRRST